MKYAHMSRQSVVKALFALFVVAVLAWQVPFNAGAEGEGDVLGATQETAQEEAGTQESSEPQPSEAETQEAEAALTVTCSGSPNPADPNEPVMWTSNVSGGIGSYAYSWTGNGSFEGNATGPLTAANVTTSYHAAGQKNANVTVTSGAQTKTATCSINVAVNPGTPLAATCEASPNPAAPNEEVRWIARPVGGTGSYTYLWGNFEQDPPNQTTQVVETSYPNPGTKNAEVTVTSGSERVTAQCSLQVSNSTNNCDRAADLSATNISASGNQVTTTITNGSVSCAYDVTMVSYRTGDWDFNPSTRDQFLRNQQVFDSETVNLAPGQSRTVSVTIPSCNYQVDVLQYTNGADPVPDNGLVIDNGHGNQYWLFEFDVQLGRGSCFANPGQLSVACVGAPNPAAPGQVVTWTSTVTGGTGSNTYAWTGNGSFSENATSTGVSGPQVRTSYWAAGQKNANLTVTSGGQTATAQCSIQVQTPPPGDCVANRAAHLQATDVAIVNGRAQSTVTNVSTLCTYNVGMVSYKVGTWDFNPATRNQFLQNQEVFDSQTRPDLAPGQSVTLSVALPQCNYQVDVYEYADGADPVPDNGLILDQGHGNQYWLLKFKVELGLGSCFINQCPASPTITSPTTAQATLNAPFTYTATVSGGVAPVAVTVTAINPAPGLSINGTTISGTPTTPGTYSYSISARSAGAGPECAVTQTLTITIPPSPQCPIPAPTINPGGSATGVVGQAFSRDITINGTHNAPTVTGLPAGLTFTQISANLYRISGTPTTAGTSQVSISTGNQCGAAQATLPITVSGGQCPIAPPSITSASSVSGTVGSAFSHTITASGGTPMSFAATNLPPGLSFSSTTRIISGTPTTAGTFDVAVTVTNQCGAANQGLRITIGGGGDDDDDDDDDDGGGGGGRRRRPNVVLFSEPEVAGASISLAQVPYTGFGTSLLQIALFIIGLLAISAGLVYAVTRKLRRNAERSMTANEYPVPASTANHEPFEVVSDAAFYEAEYARMHGPRVIASVASSMPRTAEREPDFGTMPYKAPARTAAPAALERVSAPMEQMAPAAPRALRAAQQAPLAAEMGEAQVDPARIQTEARASRTLISDDGAALIAHAAEGDEKRALERLSQVIDIAKTRYPREDGWLILDKDRVRESLFISTLSMIPLFVEWMVRAEDKKVFTFLRMLKHQEQPVADFMRKVVSELDSAHRARLEGAEERAHANAHIAEVTYHLSNKELEAIVAELLHGVDERYDSAYTSVRLSLVRVLDMVKERSLRAVGTPYAYAPEREGTI